MPCLGISTEEDPEEYIKKNFGDQYSEYEYVIENLAITAVPKAILDEIPLEEPKKTKKTKAKIKSLVGNKKKSESQHSRDDDVSAPKNNTGQFFYSKF